MKRFAITIMTFALAVSAARAQDQDLKVYESRDPWGNFGIGSWVRLKVEVDLGIMITTVETLQTLKKITDQDYTIRVESTSMMGKEDVNHVREKGADSVLSDPEREKVGEEKLKIGDKEYECTIWKSVSEQRGVEMERKEWLAEGIDFPLKIVSKSGGPMAPSVEMTATNLKDTVKIEKDRIIECVRYEGKIQTAMGGGTTVQWLSLDIPGGLVKMKAEIMMQGQGVRTSTNVVDFDVKK